MKNFLSKIQTGGNPLARKKGLPRRLFLVFLLSVVLWSGVGFLPGFINKVSIVEAAGECSQFRQGTEDYNACMAIAIKAEKERQQALVPETISKSCDEFARGSQDWNACVAKVTKEAEDAKAAEEERRDKTFYTKAIEYAKTALVDGLGRTIMMIQGILLQIIAIPILSMFLRIAGAMLDMAIQFSLSTKMYKATESGVVIVWSLIRNICNITFIFILLWASIQTIIGIAGSSTKKIIANVVIAAILINFSLFITRILIDAGNIIAVSLYESILRTGKDPDLSAIIVDILGLSNILEMSNVANNIFSISFGIISWLQVITILSALIVFIYAMLLMAARTVMLIFLTAMSPIGFMGNVIPKFGEYSKMWRENLYGQIMISPIFLLFLYLIILVGKAFNGQTLTKPEIAGPVAAGLDGAGATASIAAGTSGDYMAYFRYVMIIMLLVVAVKITKKMTGEIGKIVEKFGGAVAGIALGAATGGLALLGTKTLGAGASKLMNSKLGEKMKDSDRFGSRMALKGLNATSKASFDARNTKSLKAATGFVGDRTGIKVDTNRGLKIKKDGFQGAVDRNTTREEDYAKLVTKNMPEITADDIKNKREESNTLLASKRASITVLENQNIPEDPEEFRERESQIAKLKIEADTLEKNSKADDKTLEKQIENDAKKARLEVHAKAAEKSVINWMIGGKGARKAAAKKIRKLGKEKTSDELRREADKQLAKEKKEAGIKDEEEKEKKPEPPATPPPPAPAP